MKNLEYWKISLILSLIPIALGGAIILGILFDIFSSNIFVGLFYPTLVAVPLSLYSLIRAFIVKEKHSIVALVMWSIAILLFLIPMVIVVTGF